MINIVYSANKKLFKGILLSTLSIIKHCKEPIHIFILSNDVTYQNPNYELVTDDQTAFLNKIIKDTNADSVATLHDISPLYDAIFKNSKNKNTSYSPYTLNRLFIDMIDEIGDKTIYIDTDTMALQDISLLYNIDVEDYEFAAVLDHMGKYWMSPTYTNNGVLLLNVKKIRETKLLEKSRIMVRDKWMKMPDQSAMNGLVRDKLIIDRRFNEQRDIKPDTVIKHFCNGIKLLPFFHVYNIKQWDIDRVHKVFKIHDFDDLFDIYLDLAKKYPFIMG